MSNTSEPVMNSTSEPVTEEKGHTPGPDAIDISPNQNKGVLKEITQAGTGTATPQKGNKVFVHYTGKLMDGTVFDSSRNRGELFDFTLGKGQVIKAWDIGVKTMKKGEICILTCHPDYAYGESGSPPKIPPNATLVFEVELVQWQLEDLTNDNGVLRSIITEGEGDNMPNDDASVKIHIIGRHNGKTFEDRDVEFDLGEGPEHGIVEGIEIALKHFQKGETSKIVLKSSYAFGAAGKPEYDIPPHCGVEYEVTLISFEKAKESWELNSEEKLEQSEIVKTKGTKFFKDGRYSDAVKQYKKIVSYLQYEGDLKDEKLEQRNILLVAGHLNLAACYLKLNESLKAIESCNKALEMEPKNVKGLFRGGQAKLATNDFDDAKLDFQHLLEVDPLNKAAQKQLFICNEKIKQQREKEKKLYKNMFAKLTNYNEKNGEQVINDTKLSDFETEDQKCDSPASEQMEAAKA